MISKKIGLFSAALLLLGSQLANAGAPIKQIYFTNNTDLALNATIAGRPGKPIAAKAQGYAVPYMVVYVACQYTGMQKACPIEFTDQKTGSPVAKVVINAEQAQVLGAPTLFGTYASQYDIYGWQSTPVSHIHINYKGE